MSPEASPPDSASLPPYVHVNMGRHSGDTEIASTPIHVNMGRRSPGEATMPPEGLEFDAAEALRGGVVDETWVGQVVDAASRTGYQGVSWIKDTGEKRTMAGTRSYEKSERVDIIVNDAEGNEVGTIPVGRLRTFLSGRIRDGIIGGKIHIPKTEL